MRELLAHPSISLSETPWDGINPELAPGENLMFWSVSHRGVVEVVFYVNLSDKYELTWDNDRNTGHLRQDYDFGYNEVRDGSINVGDVVLMCLEDEIKQALKRPAVIEGLKGIKRK